jgi:vacuolar-type H+-ATPase subunit E/Vma4
MTFKAIEILIREHYQAHNGEWLVEKGKTKEARLLKEACETIEQLRRSYAASESSYYNMMISTSKKQRELDIREKVITQAEKSLRERIESTIKGMHYLLEKTNDPL